MHGNYTIRKWNATNYMIHFQLFALQSYRCGLHLLENVSINLAAFFFLSTFIYRFRIRSVQNCNWWMMGKNIDQRCVPSHFIISELLDFGPALENQCVFSFFFHPFLIFMLILKFCVNTMRFLFLSFLQNAFYAARMSNGSAHFVALRALNSNVNKMRE